MRRSIGYLAVCTLLLGVSASTKAQDILVPAGTLLRCTMDEPNFSSKTADIGDPVICHLAALRQFGKSVRIGFPDSDIPVPSKIIAAKGYKVDKKGDIVGKGHPTRDTVEWLIPPLWPWKVLTLPARGPRPTLKGEEQITVRLMDDIDVPRPGSLRSYERPPAPASYHSQSFRKPVSLKNTEKPVSSPVNDNGTPDASQVGLEAANTAPAEAGTETAASISDTPAQTVRTSSVVSGQPARVRLIALKSENVYAVTNYRINGGSLSYVLASGGKGSVDLTEVDWRATSRLNAEPASAGSEKTISAHINQQ